MTPSFLTGYNCYFQESDLYDLKKKISLFFQQTWIVNLIVLLRDCWSVLKNKKQTCKTTFKQEKQNSQSTLEMLPLSIQLPFEEENGVPSCIERELQLFTICKLYYPKLCVPWIQLQ